MTEQTYLKGILHFLFPLTINDVKIKRAMINLIIINENYYLTMTMNQ